MQLQSKNVDVGFHKIKAHRAQQEVADEELDDWFGNETADLKAKEAASRNQEIVSEAVEIKLNFLRRRAVKVAKELGNQEWPRFARVKKAPGAARAIQGRKQLPQMHQWIMHRGRWLCDICGPALEALPR